jgi:hypothetical protein
MAAIFELTASSFPAQQSSAEFEISDDRPDPIDDEAGIIAWDDFLTYRDEVRS